MFIFGHRVIIAAEASEPEANEQGSRSFFYICDLPWETTLTILPNATKYRWVSVRYR